MVMYPSCAESEEEFNHLIESPHFNDLMESSGFRRLPVVFSISVIALSVHSCCGSIEVDITIFSITI